MKRFFALLLVLTLALPAAALAEEYEMGALTIENIMLAVDGEAAKPLGIDGQFTLGADEKGERGVADFVLRVEGRDVLQGTGALEDGVLKLFFKGMSRALALPLEDLEKEMEFDIPEDADPETAEAYEDMQKLEAAMQEFLRAYFEYLAKMANGELEAEVQGKEAEILKWYQELGLLSATGESDKVAVVDRVLELPRYRMEFDYADLFELVEGMGEFSPSFQNFWEAYVKYLNTLAELSDEEFKFGPELFDELGVEMRLSGDMWMDDKGENFRAAVEVFATEQAEGGEGEPRTVRIPFTLEGATDETGSTMTMGAGFGLDDVRCDMSVYAHELNYNGLGSDQLIVTFNVEGDGEAVSMNLTGSNRTNPDGSHKMSAVFEIGAPDGRIYANLTLDGATEAREGGEAYAGHATFDCGAEDLYNDANHQFSAEFDLSLNQADLPEGALIDEDLPTLNPIKASEEEMTQFGNELSGAVMSGVMSILSTPFISDMIQQAQREYMDSQTEPASPVPMPDRSSAATGPAADLIVPNAA